jgi:hypothetical protein
VSKPPEPRVSDADREATITQLRVAGGDGRLTLEELAERVELADGARTQSELDVLTADLPVHGPARTRPVRKPQEWIVAVMGGAERKGRWRPADHTRVVTVMGGAELDLREAELADEISITAITVMGGIGIVVPEGVSVELSGFALMGANSGPRDKVPPVPDAPVVRVKTFALMGGVGIERKRPRRSAPYA